MRLFRSLSFSISFSLPAFLVALLLVLVISRSVARADEASDWTALIEARKQIGEDAFKNRPQNAVVQLQKFQKSRSLDPILEAEVILQIAEIQRAQLNHPEKSMQLLETGWQNSRTNLDPLKPVAVMYLEGGAGARLESKQPAEAKKLLEANYALIEMAAKSGHAHMEQFASRAVQRLVMAQEALRPAGEAPADTIALLRKTLLTLPVFLDPQRQQSVTWSEGWMYEDLMAALSKAGRDAEALSWGRLYFAEAAYDKTAIERATRALSAAWASQNDLVKVRAFVQAQTGDTKVPNPLDEVTLPALADDASLRLTLNGLRELQKKTPWRGRIVPMITINIARGDWAAAMEEAQGLLTSDPALPDGPLQIARVLKAKDGDIARANTFLSYLDGKAPNPLPAFFTEIKTNTVGPRTTIQSQSATGGR